MEVLIELVVALVFPVLGGIVTAIRSFRFVQEGQRALKLRFGKARKKQGEYYVVEPGLRILIPYAERFAITHVRQRTINMPSQTIVLSDDTVFEVSAVLHCRVKDSPIDLYSALFETTDLEGSLSDYGLLMVREVVGDKTYKDLFGESRQGIGEELRAQMQLQADQWGVEIIKFELSDCKPNEGSVRLIQTAAQTRFKVMALQQAAELLGGGEGSAHDIEPALASVLVGTPMVVSHEANSRPQTLAK